LIFYSKSEQSRLSLLSLICYYCCHFDCILKSGTFGIPGLVLPERGTAWLKYGTSQEIRDVAIVPSLSCRSVVLFRSCRCRYAQIANEIHGNFLLVFLMLHQRRSKRWKHWVRDIYVGTAELGKFNLCEEMYQQDRKSFFRCFRMTLARCDYLLTACHSFSFYISKFFQSRIVQNWKIFNFIN